MLFKNINYKVFLFFILISMPIYITFSFSSGFIFNSYPGGFKAALPSIAIPLIIIFIIFMYKYLYIIKKRYIFTLFIIMFIFLYIALLQGANRVVINFIGMFIPIIVYEIVKERFKNTKYLYEHYFYALYSIFIIKLITDLLLRGTLFSPNYILDSVIIYSFYDYFPFFYLLLSLLSFYNIFNKQYIFHSLLVLIVTYSLAYTNAFGARLFIYIIYLIPILFIVYKVLNYKTSLYYTILLSILIVVTILVGYNHYLFIYDGSLHTRAIDWYNYASLFEPINFIFPIYGETSKFSRSGSSHNEFVELFRYFGVSIFYYYYIIYRIFNGIQKEYRMYSFVIMFTILIGALIQINFTNQYLGILIGTTLAIFSIKRTQ
jgi:hypothetical protein